MISLLLYENQPAHNCPLFFYKNKYDGPRHIEDVSEYPRHNNKSTVANYSYIFYREQLENDYLDYYSGDEEENEFEEYEPEILTYYCNVFDSMRGENLSYLEDDWEVHDEYLKRQQKNIQDLYIYNPKYNKMFKVGFSRDFHFISGRR